MTVKFTHITLFLLLGLAVGCKKEPTSWNTSYMVPLIEGQLDPSYLFDKNYAQSQMDNSIKIHWVDEIVNYNIDSLYTIPDTSLVKNFTISLNSITAPAGFQFFTDNDDLVFDVSNGVELNEVGFSQGEIEIKVNNPIETDVFVTLDLPGVQNNGTPISINARVPKMVGGVEGSYDTLIPVQGFIFDLTGSSGASFNSLASNITLQTDPNGPDVTITNQDLFQTTLALKNLENNYAKGYFGQHFIEAKDHFTIDALKNFTNGNIGLDSIDLKLVVKNGFKIIATAQVNEFSGFNNRNGSQITFSHPVIGTEINLNPAINAWNNVTASEYTLNITNINSNVTGLLSVLPDSLVYDVEATINPLGNVSGGNDVAYPKSRFVIESDLSFPAQLSINQLEFTDTFEVSFERNTDRSHLYQMQLKVVTENSFPLNGNIALSILHADGSSTALEDKMILQSPVILNNGQTESAVESTAIFSLTPEQTELLATEDAQLILKATMETDGGTQQTFYSNQMIKYKIFGNAGIQLKF